MNIEINWTMVTGVLMIASGAAWSAWGAIRKLIPVKQSSVVSSGGTSQADWVKEICSVCEAIPAEQTLEILKAGSNRTAALEAVVKHLTEGAKP